jgi:hypothetical protein
MRYGFEPETSDCDYGIYMVRPNPKRPPAKTKKASGQNQKGLWPNQKGPLLIDCRPIWICEKNHKTT